MTSQSGPSRLTVGTISQVSGFLKEYPNQRHNYFTEPESDKSNGGDDEDDGKDDDEEEGEKEDKDERPPRKKAKRI